MVLKKGDSTGSSDDTTVETGGTGRSRRVSPRNGARAGVVPRAVGAGRKAVAKASLPPTRKGSLTRNKLKAAALRALELKGYRSLRLTDIAREADVNISLVYHYFQDKADLVFEALRDVVSIRQVIEADEGRPRDSFPALVYANKRFADFYQAHPGLVRSLVHFDEENPEFHALYAEINQSWMERIAENIQKRSNGTNLSAAEAFPIAYAVGSMVEKFLFDLYVERNPELSASFPTTDDAARFLAILWYRALHLEAPTTAEIGPFEKLGQLRLAPKV